MYILLLAFYRYQIYKALKTKGSPLLNGNQGIWLMKVS
jgi:hypothetical protein